MKSGSGSIRALGWVVLGLWVVTKTCLARDVILEWDPNVETNLQGYRLYQSGSSLIDKTPSQALLDSQVKTMVIQAGANSCTVTGLELNTPYFYRLTALNTSGGESDFNLDSTEAPAQVMVYLQDEAVKAAQKFLTPGMKDGINDEARFGPDAKEIFILNLHGRKVFHASRSASGGDLVWACQDEQGKMLPSGIYIGKLIRQDGSAAYQNFIIVK